MHTYMSMLRWWLDVLLLVLCFLGGYHAIKPPTPSQSHAWPSTFRAHIVRGVRRAISEGYETRGLKGGAVTASRLATMIAQELVVSPLTMVPLALRIRSYRSKKKLVRVRVHVGSMLE